MPDEASAPFRALASWLGSLLVAIPRLLVAMAVLSCLPLFLMACLDPAPEPPVMVWRLLHLWLLPLFLAQKAHFLAYETIGLGRWLLRLIYRPLKAPEPLLPASARCSCSSTASPAGR